MKKKCALYVRSSEIEQSRELQLNDLHDFAKARGLRVVRVYEDYGVGPVEERGGIKELLAAAAMGAFDYVIVWRIDRIAASHKHLLSIVQDIDILGIGLISVRDQLETLSEQGELIRHLFQVFTHFHAKIMAERAQAGINGSRRKGCFFGRTRKVNRAKVMELLAKGYSQAKVARAVSCSQGVISKIVKESMHRTEAV